MTPYGLPTPMSQIGSSGPGFTGHRPYGSLAAASIMAWVTTGEPGSPSSSLSM